MFTFSDTQVPSLTDVVDRAKKDARDDDFARVVKNSLIAARHERYVSAERLSECSSVDLARRMIERRAVEAALWGMPLICFDALRQAYIRDAGANYNDVVYWSRPPTSKHQVAGVSDSMRYALAFVNLKDGPVVVDVPPASDDALRGSLLDAWNVPLIDMGPAGADRGRGAKYLLLAPDHEFQTPSKYIPVRSTTYNLCAVFRWATPPSAVEASGADRALEFFRSLLVHPFAANSQVRTAHHKDISGERFDAIPSYDIHFFTSLARMVTEEPVHARDVATMGLLHALGIGKDVTFQTTTETEVLLKRAIAEAQRYMTDGFRYAGCKWWPERRWRLFSHPEALQSDSHFYREDRVLVDERAVQSFGAFGATCEPPSNLYLKTHEDHRGETLNGAKVYILRFPARAPTQFWSLAACDAGVGGFLRDVPAVGVHSRDSKMRENGDGSIHVYFAPNRPAAPDANWIPTVAGRTFFVVFRNHTPQKSELARTSSWTLGDVEEVEFVS